MNKKRKLMIFGGGQFSPSDYRRSNPPFGVGIW